MNPRAALTTYSLSRGAPSASLGTSPNCPRFVIFQNNSFRILMLFIQFLSSSPKNLVHYIALSICLSSTFLVFSKTFFSNLTSGESGIRTHAPLRTNGFQDRLVMTTSISLHIMFFNIFVLFCQRMLYSIIKYLPCQ